ncbi:MAG: hypothetical protein MJZ41_06675 [Bacteroidaceae bacterium]|nr:hypothetical protein [Bacteroidaceae bacterium]
MKKNIALLTCCIFILFTAFTCDSPGLTPQIVRIENKTNDTIHFVCENPRLTSSEFFSYKHHGRAHMIQPNSFTVIGISPVPYELVDFIFLTQTILNKYSEQEIIDNDLLHYQTYNYSMLESNNYTVVYTGEPQDSINIIEEQYEK